MPRQCILARLPAKSSVEGNEKKTKNTDTTDNTEKRQKHSTQGCHVRACLQNFLREKDNKVRKIQKTQKRQKSMENSEKTKRHTQQNYDVKAF